MKLLFFRALRLPFYIFCLSAGLTVGAVAQDKDWRPVTPAELASKSPVVDADADAEATFWEVRIDDSSSDDLSLKHYVRVKIFTDRGREKYSKFDVPFRKGMKIKDLAARVIKSDGSITEIRREDIFEREIIRTSGVKIKAKSFAVPNIEPGVIIEYRYKEAIDDAGAVGMRLQFQRDIPVQNLSYYYKPYRSNEPSYQSYNFNDTKFTKDRDGFYLAKRTNVPAIKEEPRMPPDDTVRPWMLLIGSRFTITNISAFSISYTVKDPSSPAKYWAAVSGEKAGFAKFMTKSSGDLKKAAAEITAGAATPEEKLRKIYDFCQTQIHNTTFDPTITDEQRQKLPPVKSMNDVLKRRSGSSQYIDMLFGALANASGFEIRLAMTGDRSEIFFDPNMINEALIRPAAISVKVGDQWKFFNPGVRYLPFGMLSWYEEDNWALLVGEDSFLWVRTPLSGHYVSKEKRTGKFSLSEDGTLTGDVQIELTGQPAISYRIDKFDETAAKREEDLIQTVKNRVSLAEVSDVRIENFEDVNKPVVQRYKLRIPNYAQKTGKRLFFQPGVFEYGSGAVFSSSTRKHDIYFRYPWSEEDTIDVLLPAGYELDSADSPGLTSDGQKIGSLDIRIAADKDGKYITYDRKFHFGGGGHILFKAESYSALKSLFDAFHKSDTHTLTLKQK